MDDTTKKPPITLERAREALSYDEDTGVLTWKARLGTRCTVGAAACRRDKRGYVYITVDGRQYFGHRLAWLIHFGEWPACQIDHINGIKDGNRIANLRDVTGMQNMQNQHTARRHNITGIRGVSRNGGKYQSEILANGHRRFLGTFATAEAAREAYLTAKQQHHKFEPTGGHPT